MSSSRLRHAPSLLFALAVLNGTPFAINAQVGIALDGSVERSQAKAVELLRSGRNAEAVEIFRRVVELKREDGEAHYHLGVALTASGSYVEASESLSIAIELKPKMAEAHHAMCVARFNLKQYLKALNRAGRRFN